MAQNLHIDLRKRSMDFPILLLLYIPSHFITVLNLTLWVLDNFGPDLAPNCLQRLSDEKVASSRQRVNTEQLLDTTFWLKP